MALLLVVLLAASVLLNAELACALRQASRRPKPTPKRSALPVKTTWEVRQFPDPLPGWRGVAWKMSQDDDRVKEVSCAIVWLDDQEFACVRSDDPDYDARLAEVVMLAHDRVASIEAANLTE